ncbi:hypothetical protein [Agrilutibacter solisilvae]|uniref:Uncharacterized protein n=1 Tax=Agrilutibacter solisilvae TaxID=2763317 RepID=A0A975ASD4_9GAMM|nr:hypothetical protein [Lysobacter solisilvae]QSX77949.1 hypothetical protein I8J32_014660 [Lysobacter solisilvae]
MATAARAGDNERRFHDIFVGKAPGTPLLGKKRYASGGVEISVDQSFVHDDREVLIEIDSANMAKLIVGQYVLLNHLRDSDKPAFFLVVHAYRKFNPVRTISNLDLVNQKLFFGKGLAFGAMHFDELSSWGGDVTTLLTIAQRSSN